MDFSRKTVSDIHEEISDEELNSLSRAILTRYDVDFTCYESKSLKRRIARAISYFKVDGIHGLWVKLLRDRDFIYPLIDELTVGLTSMFRDPIMWTSLKNNVLLKEFRNKSSINIWHAGCSTGEEVFSMGIVLQDARIADKATAYASDINQASLQKSAAGIYEQVKLDDYKKEFVKYNNIARFERYYTPILGTNNAQMDLNLIKHVKFGTLNLVTEKPKEKYDIIFCRNVMIYFDNKTKMKMLDQFYEALNPGGFFIIGFYDALVSILDKQKFEFYDLDAKIFRKIGG